MAAAYWTPALREGAHARLTALATLFLAASASATAVRMSCTENGFVTTSCTMALRPEARSR